MRDKGENYPDPEGPPKRDNPQQLLINNVCTYSIENVNRTD